MNVPRAGGWVRPLIAGLVLLVPALVSGATIRVEPGDKSGIAEALAAASAGDVILVGCGSYLENMLVMPDGVILRGLGDASCVQIKTPGIMPLFYCEGVGSTTRIENLSMWVDAGGQAPVSRGAGVYLENASPVFSGVRITGLEADYGGAVYCGAGSSPTFEDCWFDSNSALAVGGAVACTESSAPVFERCLFEGNSAAVSGGAINVGYGSGISLIECTLVGGSGGFGGGLATWDAAAVVMDRVIIADGAGGSAWSGDFASAPVPFCSDIYGNAGGDWVGAIAPHAATGGNISLDPEFCGAESANPFTLYARSPCAMAACGVMGAFPVDCDHVSPVPPGGVLPSVSRLHANVPNPFNPRTTVKFDLSRSGPVDLAVFDVAGRMVKRLVDRTMTAGVHEAVWEGRDTGGRRVAAGVYFLRLKTPDTIDTKRMTLVK